MENEEGKRGDAGREILAPQWQRYGEAHHRHMGLREGHPLRSIEFAANFARRLPPPPARILDLGCGLGWTLSELSRLGYEDLCGWDISADCIEEATRRGVPAVLRHVDGLVELEKTGADQFDAVLAKDLLEHLEYGQVLPFLEGVFRVLKPGGLFLARLPNMANPFACFLRYDDFTHRVGFTENSLRQVLVLSGFDRERIRIANDRLPGWSLLRHGLIRTFLREKVTGPLTRLVLKVMLESQRKGSSRVGTLRLIVAAEKG
ncbi:MAG: class I SAM-dependent methyltransferase [Bradymonadales bacterium]|nr:class I SAM-dependent methyltransferase [Bradymonadales bacterium]